MLIIVIVTLLVFQVDYSLLPQVGQPSRKPNLWRKHNLKRAAAAAAAAADVSDLADPGRARGCSTNTSVTDSLIHRVIF